MTAVPAAVTRELVAIASFGPPVFGKPTLRPAPLPRLGTGAAWVDLGFGMSQSVEELVRLLRERRCSECAAARLRALAAESGTHDHLIPPVADSEIEDVPVRRVARGLARKKILAYIKANPDSDALDIAVALRLDPPVVFAICDELVKEGRVKFAGDAATDRVCP